MKALLLRFLLKQQNSQIDVANKATIDIVCCLLLEELYRRYGSLSSHCESFRLENST